MKIRLATIIALSIAAASAVAVGQSAPRKNVQRKGKHHAVRHYVRHYSRHYAHPKRRFVHRSHALPKGVRLSGAENALLGVHLYDSELKVIRMFGSPDDVLALSTNVSTTSGNNGGPGGPGGFGPPRGPGGPAFGNPGGAPGFTGKKGPGGFAPGGIDAPFAPVLRDRQMGPPGLGPGAGGYKGGGKGGGGFSPGGPPGGAPGGAPGLGGGQSTTANYTRWVYNRDGCKYSFVLDKFGHVIQIEAIGLRDSKVRTHRGISFGATFAKVLETYGVPDGYEINGSNVLVKYLTKLKVAFRLTRLQNNQPQVVTGIVVAAAKD